MSFQRTRNDNAGPSLRLLTLGGLTLLRTSGAHPERILGAGKPAALLAYLTTLPGRQAGREHLKDLLWSDLSPPSADHAFRQAVWLLRRRIGQGAIVTDNGALRLTISLHTDRDAFLAAVEATDLGEAIHLYQGDFLQGVALPGGLEHEHWADAERYRLRLIFLRTAEVVVRRRLEVADFRDAVPLARRVRDADPSGERSWRLLIEALVSTGDLVSADVEADSLERMLAADERDAEPSTTALLARVRHRDRDLSGGNESHLIAELVGREHEFSRIVAQWKRTQEGHGAHLHIVAPAGLGKSRLLHDINRRLRISGARTVMLRANSGDRAVPYSFAGDLARTLGTLPGASGVAPGLATHLVALHPQLSNVFDVEAAVGGGSDLARHRTLAVAEVMAAAAEDRPFALLIDDLHWVDSISQQLIASVVERCRSTAVLIVTTARPTVSGRLATPGTAAFSLSPLTVDQVADLVDSIATTPNGAWPDRLPMALHAATGGSPLLILEALQLAGERGWLILDGGAWRCDDPDALFDELARGGPMARRIAVLDPVQCYPLLLLAIAGTPLDEHILNHLSRGTDASERLTDLERRGFIQREPAGWTVAHDELAQTVLESATGETRRAAHLAIGTFRTTETGAGALTRAADHFVQAREEDRLTELLRRRLSLARARGEPIALRRMATDLLGPHAADRRVNRLIGSLPKHIAWRYSRFRMGAAAALAAGLVLAGALAWQPETPPVEALLTFNLVAASGTVEGYTIPVDADAWDAATPLATVSEATLSALGPFARDSGRLLHPSPDGRRWIVERVMDDSGGVDLFLVDGDTETRLTRTRGDDEVAHWSPDGGTIALHTGRWNANGWYDLATIDVKTLELRRLTDTRAHDQLAGWSPDGSRVAYYREWVTERRSAQVCHVARDGTGEQCTDAVAGPWLGVIGWYDVATLVVVALINGQAQPALFDLQRQVLQPIALRYVGLGTVSPDGRWLACRCAAPGDERVRWLVMPTDRPRDARPIISETTLTAVRWQRGAFPGQHVDSLAIVAPTSEFPLETHHQLLVEGFDAAGHRVSIGTVRWAIDNPSIATIDQTGVITPHALGVVRVRASLGGWREATTTVRVVPASYEVVLREDWTQPLETQWRPFGEPRPTLVTSSDGVPAMLNHGDGSFHSGVYRHLNLGAGGLGIDVRLSTEITELHWQQVYVQMEAARDTSWYALWDHRTSAGPLTDDSKRCAFTVPTGEGYRWHGTARAAVNRTDQYIVNRDDLGSGDWFTLRVQVFPDGRCGVAINGQAVWKSTARVTSTGAYRVWSYGNSVETHMLVGPLEVWKGVRPGVDWEAVQPDH